MKHSLQDHKQCISNRKSLEINNLQSYIRKSVTLFSSIVKNIYTKEYYKFLTLLIDKSIHNTVRTFGMVIDETYGDNVSQLLKDKGFKITVIKLKNNYIIFQEVIKHLVLKFCW